MEAIELQGDSIRSAVTRAVKKAFPDVKIYKERVNEGMVKPYFMIKQESFEEKALKKPYYLQTYIISVLYQCKDLPETSYTDFNNVTSKLSDAVDLIEIKDTSAINQTTAKTQLLRGTEKNSYVENDELEFYVNYNIRVAKPQESTSPKMTNLQRNVTDK